MALIRPEIVAWFAPRRELVAAIALMSAGLWLAARAGWLAIGLGLVLAVTGAIWAQGAWRRLSFRREIAAPGVVEIVEGEVRFFAPRALGGAVALRDLAEIRLIRLNGHDHWRLKSRAGEALLIPVEARGAEGLADAFAALPGLDMGRVSAALNQRGGPSLRIVWTAPA
ncbi:MAG: hypothetical protein Q4G25_14640 [Paracoccus sp. (in: a-proteobacteria)]|nr:hypothetical protein [Paracoccus sp. (in: a-proteobacteria)]